MRRLQPAADVELVEGDSGAILFDSRSGQLYRLNAAGLVYWLGLASGGDHDQAVAAVVAEFACPLPVARNDAGTLARRLLDLGLVHAGD